VRAVGARRVPYAVQARALGQRHGATAAPLLRRWHPYLNVLGMLLLTGILVTFVPVLPLLNDLLQLCSFVLNTTPP
jgi:hypothetical protein